MQLPPLLFESILFTCSMNGMAQHNIGTGLAKEIFLENCASCHGEEMAGEGSVGSLIDGEWQFGDSDVAIADVVRRGRKLLGMPGFDDKLSTSEIRSLVILIRESEQLTKLPVVVDRTKITNTVFTTQHHNFKLELVAERAGTLWGLDVLPGGSLLATQQNGKLWQFKDAKIIGPIINTPKVLFAWQGGLLDVKVHPDYEKNGWIYLSYVASSNDGSMTHVVRGRLKDGRWQDQETIFSVPSHFHSNTGHHYGSRIVLDKGYIFISVGDRGNRQAAQDLSQPVGKIHRLFDDGRVPQDNPFISQKGSYSSIWTLGHRNPQGMDFNSQTKTIWASEHGPRGGDEVNLILRKRNYGWPVLTSGMNYDGSPISANTTGDGYQDPKKSWTPSISPGGIKFYHGKQFPHWKNNLFVGAMGAQELHRLDIVDKKIRKDEVIFKGLGRVRDVASDVDGNLLVLINTSQPKKSFIYRLVAAE